VLVKSEVLVQEHAKQFKGPILQIWAIIKDSIQQKYFALVLWSINVIIIEENPFIFPYFYFLPFGLKIIHFVLLTLTAILLALNHIDSFWSSLFALLISGCSSGPDRRQAVSSAKSKASISLQLGRSLMKHKNRIGPKMLPCKINIVRVSIPDSLPSISTCFKFYYLVEKTFFLWA
jgi:hypothetical protein